MTDSTNKFLLEFNHIQCQREFLFVNIKTTLYILRWNKHIHSWICKCIVNTLTKRQSIFNLQWMHTMHKLRSSYFVEIIKESTYAAYLISEGMHKYGLRSALRLLFPDMYKSEEVNLNNTGYTRSNARVPQIRMCACASTVECALSPWTSSHPANSDGLDTFPSASNIIQNKTFSTIWQV